MQIAMIGLAGAGKDTSALILQRVLKERGMDFIIDRYAAPLKRAAREVFGKDFDDLQYRVNIFEEYNSPGLLERDVTTRLSQNRYVVDLSWDPPVLDTLQVDTIFNDMTQRISARLDTSIGGLKIRAGVYDGKDYYITEVDLR